jgi:hypothetical protein
VRERVVADSGWAERSTRCPAASAPSVSWRWCFRRGRSITALRGLDAVLHNSLFRSGYELLFVPMDARMRNRAKTVLDVVCDRAGEAAGSGIVQLRAAGRRRIIASSLLAIASVCRCGPVGGQRFGTLYVGLVEDQLLSTATRRTSAWCRKRAGPCAGAEPALAPHRRRSRPGRRRSAPTRSILRSS